MRVEDELRQLFEGTQGAPWPGERQAFDRFLRRRARRGRMVAAAAGLALVAVLGAAVLVARGQPEEREAVAPAGGSGARARAGVRAAGAGRLAGPAAADRPRLPGGGGDAGAPL